MGSSDHETSDPLINSVLSGRYLVNQRVGKGSTGAVYRGTRIQTGSQVAIKVMHADLMGDIDSIKRFQREAKAASSLNHPHIVGLLDVGLAPAGQPYLVTEFIHGKTLAQRLEEHRRLDIRQSFSIMLQACETLAYAHDVGVMHCDVKPANIILTNRFEQENFVMVLDFSISKIVTKVSDIDSHNSGTIFGTPTYMSPERFKGMAGDFRSDIYSLGVIMYQLLAGHPPFNPIDRRQLKAEHLQTPPPPIETSRSKSHLPHGLEAIIMRSLAKNPQDRQPSMKHLLTELEEIERHWLPAK
jgi:serine/threonine-protein kinase